MWRTYRGRADCENRIKELKADFGLESFNLRDFWATEAALTATMLAYDEFVPSVFTKFLPFSRNVNFTHSNFSFHW